MTVERTISVLVDFEETSWSLVISSDESSSQLVFQLLWNDRVKESHCVEVPKKEFEQLLRGFPSEAKPWEVI